MKKALSAFLIAFILTAAGCGGNNQQETTEGSTTAAATEETKGSSGNRVTEIAYQSPEVEDTTEEALAILQEHVPLYYDYLKIRMNMPVTVEAVVTYADGTYLKSGIYVKDEYTGAITTETSDGRITKVIYTKNMGYQINENDKIVYYLENKEETAKRNINAMLMTISLSDLNGCSFSQDTAEFEGVTYKHEAITNQTTSENTDYYFDADTNKLKYIKTTDTVTKIDRADSIAADDSIFEIPADYEMLSYNDYLEQLQQEALEQQQAAQAEQSTAE